MTETTDSTVAELKKQTRIMAEKEASKAATGVFGLVGACSFATVLHFVDPETAGWWAVAGVLVPPIVAAAWVYLLTYDNYT